MPPEPPKTVIAALGPKMLALAAEQADGAHPYNVTPQHTAEARKILGPSKLLCRYGRLVNGSRISAVDAVSERRFRTRRIR